MNETNHWETQLRSWTLRRPSDKIAEKIFRPAAENKRAPFSWLAPVTVGALSLLVIFGAHSHSTAHSVAADTNLFFASLNLENVGSLGRESSLKTAFNLSKTDLNLEQNVWRTASFESTNRSQSPSSSRSLPVNTTNSLTR